MRKLKSHPRNPAGPSDAEMQKVYLNLLASSSKVRNPDDWRWSKNQCRIIGARMVEWNIAIPEATEQQLDEIAKANGRG